MARRVTIELEDELKEQAADHGTINELVTDWLRIKRRDSSPTTIAGYERHAKRIVARFGRVKATELTGQMIDVWYDDLLASGTTRAGIVHIHRVLRAALRWAYKKRGLPSIATDHASPPAHNSPEIRPPTTSAIAVILAALPSTEQAQWARAVRLLAFTGVRRGEVVGLRWDDWTPGGRLTVRTSIAEVGKVIHVLPPKGKRARDMAVDPYVDVILGQQRAWHEAHGVTSPWVFPDMRADPTGATPRRPGWISTMWGKWRVQNAPGVRLHDLRHHFATMLLDGGVPLNTVQGWLGHADPSVTVDVYGHRTPEGERQALAVVAGALGPGTA